MTTILTTPELLNNDNWFLDLRATNHVTNNLSNLNFGFGYQYRSKIHMGNGANLIAYSGFFPLCYFDSPRAFSLSNMLHVPHITCNLISVSQISRENNAFFEFHPSICIMKDLATRTPLLKGKLHKGLYRFNMFKAESSSSTSSH